MKRKQNFLPKKLLNGTTWMKLLLLLLSRSVVSDSFRPRGLQHTRLLCLPLSSGACSNSCPLSQWCHPIISSSVTPFSSCPQSFPTSGSFPVSQLFTSGGQRIVASASSSVLAMNIQGWFPLGLVGLTPLLSKGLSRIFNTTVRNKFFKCLNFLINWFVVLFRYRQILLMFKKK